MKNSILKLSLLSLIMGTTFAQTIPNNGFDTWTNPNGYNIPSNWGTMNPFTSATAVYTATKGTPGVTGSTAAYLKLISKTVTGMGIVPGIAVSGTINSDLTYDSGFSFNLRPTTLNGSFQHMISGSSQGSIKVYLTRINPTTQMKETVGTVNYMLSGMAMSWSTFTLPITYLTSDTPDHCLIVLSASGNTPANGDYLYVDNLTFTTPLGTSEFNKQVITIYPNPSKDFINIDYSSISDKVEAIEIYDILGKKVKSEKPSESLNTAISITTLSNGIYLLKLKTDGTEIVQKFIKE